MTTSLTANSQRSSVDRRKWDADVDTGWRRVDLKTSAAKADTITVKNGMGASTQALRLSDASGTDTLFRSPRCPPTLAVR